MNHKDRDELARDIFLADNWRNQYVADSDWEGLKNLDTYAHHIADRLLAAGYRKPRTVTTAEELDALPVGSVVLDREGDAWQRQDDRWHLATREDEDGYLLTEYLPVTVLHVGSV